MIIDAHPHLYSEDEVRYPPIEDPLRPPAGTGTLEHLQREMAASGVNKAVVIQTSTFYRWDNRFIRDTVQANRDWCSGVCTLDPDHPHSPDILAHLVEKYGIRGLRSIPAADRRLDGLGVEALWQQAEECGIVVNVLVGAPLATEVATMLQRYPSLKVVLDHCLNLNRSSPDFDQTLQTVCELARFPNLHAKLSFLPTGTQEPYPFSDLHPAVHQIVRAFSPQRCVWGSDFPCELWCPNVTYSQHLQLFQEELGLSRGEQEAILGATAAHLWFD